MILVTGAAGKTGQVIIRALAARKQNVRALVRREHQIAEVQAIGAVEAVVGDMRDQSVLSQAAEGTRALYHICPNVHPDEIAIGDAIIAAAMSAGVQYFVFHSVLRPQIESMPHHWKKMRVEEALFESGLAFTILQPASYMQNVISIWDGIVDRGVLAAPYSVQSQSSPVDLHDVAAAAAIVPSLSPQLPHSWRASAWHDGSTSHARLPVFANVRTSDACPSVPPAHALAGTVAAAMAEAIDDGIGSRSSSKRAGRRTETLPNLPSVPAKMACT